jgi:glycosyltransferase involved in cell wall biosynthesis
VVRLAYFVSHPIQYQAPLLRLIAKDPEIDVTVFFYSDFSLRSYHDRGFGQAITWDIPLTQGYSCEFLRCWGSPQRHRWWNQPIALDITSQLRSQSFDAVWVHGWGWWCSVQAVHAAYQLGIPVLLRGETNGLTEPVNFLKKRAKRIILRWLFRQIAGFLYIGSLNRKFYQDYGIEDDRLFSMPYAVDNDYWQAQVAIARPHQHHLRQSLGLEAHRPIILFAAKLIDVKRPLDLLAAYQLLSPDGDQEPDPYLLVVGDGVLRPELEAVAANTGWSSIRFLGFRNQSELPALYDLCDVFVLPSGVEPWGLAVNEAMNAGKAIVVSDRVGCAPDLVQQSDNGRIFPAGDPSALAEALSWALAHRTEAGKQSLQRIQAWNFQADLVGLKQALASVNLCNRFVRP